MPVIGEEITREESKVLEGLDFPIVCLRPSPPDHEAHYALICKGCGVTWYICGPHLEQIHRLELRPSHVGVMCDKCRHPGRWLTDVFRVVPL